MRRIVLCWRLIIWFFKIAFLGVSRTNKSMWNVKLWSWWCIALLSRTPAYICKPVILQFTLMIYLLYCSSHRTTGFLKFWCISTHIRNGWLIKNPQKTTKSAFYWNWSMLRGFVLSTGETRSLKVAFHNIKWKFWSRKFVQENIKQISFNVKEHRSHLFDSVS